MWLKSSPLFCIAIPTKMIALAKIQIVTYRKNSTI